MAAVHAHDPNFHICCGIGGCARTYTNFYSFKKHLYRRHRDSLEMAEPFIPGDPNTHTGGIGSDESLWNADDVQPELEREDSICTKLQQKKQMALFLLKTKEVRKVSQVALDGIIEDFTLILQETIRSLREEVNSCLTANGLSIAVFDDLPGIFDNPSTLNPFGELESKYKQERFYREHLDFLVSYFCYNHIHDKSNPGHGC